MRASGYDDDEGDALHRAGACVAGPAEPRSQRWCAAARVADRDGPAAVGGAGRPDERGDPRSQAARSCSGRGDARPVHATDTAQSLPDRKAAAGCRRPGVTAAPTAQLRGVHVRRRGRRNRSGRRRRQPWPGRRRGRAAGRGCLAGTGSGKGADESRVRRCARLWIQRDHRLPRDLSDSRAAAHDRRRPHEDRDRSAPSPPAYLPAGVGGSRPRPGTRAPGQLTETIGTADASGEPVLIVGGGSNLVAADAGWSGLVVRVMTHGIQVANAGDKLHVTVAAGETWDDFVALTVAEGWSGLAAMSGVPGLAGATPVQNVGAYGSEVADSITSLRVFDRDTSEVSDWSPAQCGFGFRTSAFKHTDRYMVLAVTFALRRSPDSVPVRYLELARRLGVEPGQTAPSIQVRDVVLDLRRSKGMVLDAG